MFAHLLFATGNNGAAKCVYDERMFAKDANADTTDPEDDYFQIMKNMNAEQRKVIFQCIIFHLFLKKLLCYINLSLPIPPYGVVFLLFIGL